MTEDDPIPLEACALPGTIKVTRDALDLAERFQAAVPHGWLAVFSWHDGERIRASKDAPWVDKGPGIGLGAYRVRDIPEEAICRAGSFRYAVLVRKDVIEDHPLRTIDLDSANKLVLK